MTTLTVTARGQVTFRTVILKGASHALIVSRPKEVATIIEEAARESAADLAARAAE
ncbi:TPA: hypothetical protein NR314_003161 [Legionella pneumophila]|nr:hypothetical protein [Legionella pneumophila]HCJ1160519.1 hypothetical protein [Legionella pneumophila]HCJ1163798.1 hypothetical protein [Legionella pneumophila]HCJ4299936.1 hypothetical protein [Legionella pneumophila]HCJ4303125.1 hypothetical protein [Legionella pneumophila]